MHLDQASGVGASATGSHSGLSRGKRGERARGARLFALPLFHSARGDAVAKAILKDIKGSGRGLVALPDIRSAFGVAVTTRDQLNYTEDAESGE